MATKKFAVLAIALLSGLGLTLQAHAGKFQFAHPGCKTVKSEVFCEGRTEPTTYREIIGKHGDFKWFKKVNNLPASATPDTPAPAYMMYAVMKRKF